MKTCWFLIFSTVIMIAFSTVEGEDTPVIMTPPELPAATAEDTASSAPASSTPASSTPVAEDTSSSAPASSAPASEGQDQKPIDMSKIENVDQVLARANEGDWESQYIYGFLQVMGNNPKVKQDVASGIALCEKAAEGGEINAQYFLGIAYATKEYVTPDKEKALYYLEMAAQNGHPLAQKVLDDAQKKSPWGNLFVWGTVIVVIIAALAVVFAGKKSQPTDTQSNNYENNYPSDTYQSNFDDDAADTSDCDGGDCDGGDGDSGDGD